jgi:hypothetical protein
MQLSGVYGRRDRLWHLGINAVPMLGDPHRLRLTPHVIYTDPAGEKEATAESGARIVNCGSIPNGGTCSMRL